MYTTTESNPFASRETPAWWDKSADEKAYLAGTMTSKEFRSIWGCYPECLHCSVVEWSPEEGA